MQFFSCACFGVILAVYALTLPECPVSRGGEQKSLVDAMGLRAFTPVSYTHLSQSEHR